MRVLYVENDQVTRTSIADGLSDLGFTVRVAASVSEAMECAVDFDPHVVVTNWDLGPIGTPLVRFLGDFLRWTSRTLRGNEELAN